MTEVNGTIWRAAQALSDKFPDLLDFSQCIDAVRVVAAALRDPSEEMCEAGARYYHDNWQKGRAKEQTDMALYWETMVDELLREES